MGTKHLAIIIGLDSLPGLQTARILFNKGIPVIGIARFSHHYATKTRACKKIYFANTQTKEFIDLLLRIGPNLDQKAVLIPCTDMSVYLLSKHRSKLTNWFIFSLPDHNLVETLQNKVKFYQLMQRLNLPIPKTFVLKKLTDAKYAAQKLKYPAVLKPSRRILSWTENSKHKVYKLRNSEEFLEVYQKVSRWVEELVIQEWVEGSDENLFSCTAYFDKNSEPLVTFMAKKIRQIPLEFGAGAGVSTLGVECKNDYVLNLTLNFLSEVKYKGLADLEVKQEEGTNKYFIMELNVGRPTVLAPIAEAGGVEYVYTMYCDLTQLPLPEKRTQKYGNVKWWNITQDTSVTLKKIGEGRLNIFDWLKSIKGVKFHAVFSLSDPLPFIFEIQQMLLRRFR